MNVALWISRKSRPVKPRISSHSGPEKLEKRQKSAPTPNSETDGRVLDQPTPAQNYGTAAHGCSTRYRVRNLSSVTSTEA
jgi:hypothetical protein